MNIGRELVSVHERLASVDERLRAIFEKVIALLGERDGKALIFRIIFLTEVAQKGLLLTVPQEQCLR